MPDYSRPLGDTVKQARSRLQLTQNELADTIGVDSRTILNIEHYKGNPKMEVLYPLIRALNIDAREIFSPESLDESPSIHQLNGNQVGLRGIEAGDYFDSGYRAVAGG